MIDIINSARSGPWNYIEESTDTQVSLTYSDENTLLIKFQGSASDVDWKHNFTFWKKPYKQMEKAFYIHAGFLKVYKSVRKRIHEEYNLKRIENVRIEGYSLGAAVATLCYEDFFWHKENNEYYKHINLSGFGLASPRVTSIIKYKEFNRRCSGFVRMENGNDAVTRLPFGFMLYKHVQNKAVIKTKKRRNPLYLLFPSSTYHHDHRSYIGHYESKDYKDENNGMKPLAIKIYKYIYLGVGLLTLAILAIKFFV